MSCLASQGMMLVTPVVLMYAPFDPAHWGFSCSHHNHTQLDI
jgi:hypothetical protein